MAALLLAGSLIACSTNPGGPTTARYVLGAPYQVGEVWYYPQESYKSVQTGLAAIAHDRHPAMTANSEAYDPTALTAGHQTLQLPAIARVVNLENGLAVTLRINDRGPARPHRLLELTPRAAGLLGIRSEGRAAGSGTQIRVEILDAESRAAVEGLVGTPQLKIAAAPRGAVQREGASAVAPSDTSPIAPPMPIQRVPEDVMQTTFGPGTLFIRLGSFSRAEYAEHQRSRLAHLAPSLETERDGRQTTYRLRIGPLQNIAAADAALDQVFRAGVSDGRIIVVHDASTPPY